MLLLLDIDGVMVPAKGWKSPELLPDGFPAFSAKAIRVLQQLLSENGTVLLTTFHKARFSVEEWKSIFKNRGLLVNNLAALPENINHWSRKEELLHWAEKHDPQEPFVILDDDASLNDLPPLLKEKWVQISPYIGLTEAHLEAIEAILQKGLRAA